MSSLKAKSHKLEPNQGFTLIELLVVIAIIGLLSSIVLVSLGATKRKAGVAAAELTMRNLQTEMENLVDANGTYPANFCSCHGKNLNWVAGQYHLEDGFLLDEPYDNDMDDSDDCQANYVQTYSRNLPTSIKPLADFIFTNGADIICRTDEPIKVVLNDPNTWRIKEWSASFHICKGASGPIPCFDGSSGVSFCVDSTGAAIQKGGSGGTNSFCEYSLIPSCLGGPPVNPSECPSYGT